MEEKEIQISYTKEKLNCIKYSLDLTVKILKQQGHFKVSKVYQGMLNEIKRIEVK